MGVYANQITIGINGNEANVEHLVGVNQYARELLCALARLLPRNTKFVVYLSQPPRAGMPEEKENWRYKILGPARFWTLTKLQTELVKEKIAGTAPDIFFTPTHYTPLVMPIPSVISVMDMSFERFGQYFKPKDLYQLKYWTWLSARQAKKILTISEFSKKEICEIYKFPSEKVVVTHCGYDSGRFHPELKTHRKYKIYNGYKGYILYLGTLQPRKNLVRLIEAFAALENANGLKLVIAGMITEGRGGWMQEDIKFKIQNSKCKNRIVLTGYVPASEVPYLMAGAEAYVLPSLYEGFGIPAIEAMAVGTPVVVSAVSSLPEICGEAAIYIRDPYNVLSIKQALEQVLNTNKTERQKRIVLGLNWVKRYNWEETARKTLEVLRGIARDKG